MMFSVSVGGHHLVFRRGRVRQRTVPDDLAGSPVDLFVTF
jgi:hypothetical protein